MRNDRKKRVLALLLGLTAAASLTACGGTEDTSSINSQASSQNESSVQSEGEEATETDAITFPLEETQTFVFAGVCGADNEHPEDTLYAQKLLENYNVQIEYLSLGSDQESALQKLNVLLGTNDAPDAIMGALAMNETFLAMYAQEGYLMPLNDYLTNPDIMPVFNERVIANNPDLLKGISLPDGNIYSLPYINQVPGTYLESPIWINQTWLDNLGLEVPTTLEELEAVMEAFATQDANGNGDTTDEIPLIACVGSGSEHLEAWLSLWGIATKDGTYENYVYLKDGEVIFVPTTEEYKDYIKTMQKWYENGWLWSEYFTGSSETFKAIQNDTSAAKYGILTAKNPVGPFADQYVAIVPPTVEGYTPSCYVNPAFMSGSKGQFEVTSNCENPELLMAFIDKFYLMENTLEAYNGIANEELKLTLEDGVYETHTLTAEQSAELGSNAFRLYFSNNIPGGILESDYESGKIIM